MEADKIKTSVKYNDLDATRNVVTMQGVTFMPGETVELTDFLSQTAAEAMARKLSTNPYFEVAGQDKQTEREEIEANKAKRAEELQAIKEKQYAATVKKAEDEGTPVPPPSVAMPETMQLAENPQARRAGRTPPAGR